MDSKHILVLGGTGFIGSRFLAALFENLHRTCFHVHLLVRDVEKIYHYQTNKQVTIYVGDLTTFDWCKLTEFPDFVYHFARINATRGGKIGRLLNAWRGNNANKRLLSFLTRENKTLHLFYLSGSLMYGNSFYPITELSHLNPTSFAREYIIAEKPFLKQPVNQRLKITMIRVPWVLGQGSWFYHFFMVPALKEKKIPIYGDGNNLMSFICLSDLASCLVALLNNEKYFNTLNIAYSQSIKQKEFVYLIKEVLNINCHQKSLVGYQKAIVEAFESNIPLSTNYHIFDSILSEYDLKERILIELRAVFKNV